MSKSNGMTASLLALVFNATAWSGIADNAASANTQIFVALHTADPGAAGTQATSEATFTSYARVAVARTGSGWSVSGSAASNVAIIQFPICTGGTDLITHFSVGMAGSGATAVLYRGALSEPVSVANGVQVEFGAGAMRFEEQ
jgi:hypothetical protein